MNAQPQEKRAMTPEEYLAMDAEPDVKYEYYNGEVFAMTGAKPDHNLINANITRELGNQFITNDSTCRVYPSDQRVKIEAIDKYTYPDITVACGDIQHADDAIKSLLNPIIIIEILSDSTEAYDRGMKFTHYRFIPSLQEYLLVSQNHCQVEQYVRGDDGGWRYFSYETVEEIVKIVSIQCELPLSEIYRWITFEKKA